VKRPTRWVLGLVAAFAGSAGCSNPTVGSLSIGLLLPESPDPRAEVGTLRIGASWDGGHLEQDVSYADGGVRLDLPTGTPMDLRIEGIAAGGGPALWRGEAHGATVPDQGNEAINVFFGKVGAFSHFASVAEMSPLSGTAAASWGAGQVLLAGGSASPGDASPQISIYDHRQVRVSRLATLLAARAFPRTLALKDAEGQDFLMVAGGLGTGGGPLASVELFRPPGMHVPLPPLIWPQSLPGAASLDPSGQRIVIGCGAGAKQLTQVQVYAPAVGFLDGGNPLPDSPVQLGDDCRGAELAQAQGQSAAFVSGEVRGGIERIENGGHSVGAAGTVPTARTGFTAIDSPQGLVLIGGRKSGIPTDEVNRVNDGAKGKLREPRADFAWLVVPDARVLIVGGRAQATAAALATAEWLDPATLTSAPAGQMEVGRIRSALAQIPGYGAALVVSGEDESGSPVGGLEIYTYP